MQSHPGIFIVLEGSDGSGKTTQFRLLKERLEAVGYSVEVFKFPQYEKPSSHFIRAYLEGKYGPASNVSPYTASLFYALDRYEAGPRIREAIAEGKVVLSDRYVGANMAHQGSKFTNEAEQRGFFIWEDSMEFQLLGIPRADFNIFLRVPAEIAHVLIKERAVKQGIELDEHEKDINHLRKAVGTYDLLCKLFPKDFKSIECTENGNLLSITDVNEKIWSFLKPYIKDLPRHEPHSKVVNLNETKIVPKTVTLESTLKQIKPRGQLKITLKPISLLALRHIMQCSELSLSVDFTSQKQKNASFYQPPELAPKAAKIYAVAINNSMETAGLIEKVINRSKLKQSAKAQTGEIKNSILPLAAYVSVTLSGKSQDLVNLAASLSSSDLKELRDVSVKLKDGLNGSDRPIREHAGTAMVDAKDKLGFLSAHGLDLAEMSDFWPRNEFDLLVDLLYGDSSLARAEISQTIDTWPYDKKAQTISRALRTHNPQTASALNQVRYKFDFTLSGITLNYLKLNAALSSLVIQAATPRYGYDLPVSVEKLGIEDLYLRCFDESLGLFSELQAQGGKNNQIAQYAVLLGHKTRFQASIGLNELMHIKDLLSAALAPSESHQLLNSLNELVGEVHPIIGEIVFHSVSNEEVKTAAGDTRPGQSARRPAKKAAGGEKPSRHRRRKRK